MIRRLPLSSQRFLHSWPAAKNPTPYQIFGIDPLVPLDKKALQRTFVELAKQYHPDRSATGNADRFKKLVEAHGILKDDTKRRSYDFTHSMARTAPRYQNQAQARRPDDDFEDFDTSFYWSNQGQKNFENGLRENRLWVLKLVLIMGSVFAVLNFLFLKKVSEIRSEISNAETEKVAAQLAAARGITGGNAFANSPSDRIARFLQHRQRLLERFDNEFSYDKMRSGMSRRELGRVGDTVYYDTPDGQVETEVATPLRRPPSNGIGERQAKPNTGRVAEAFGRT